MIEKAPFPIEGCVAFVIGKAKGDGKEMGKILAEGTMDEIKSNETVNKVYLGD